MIQKLTEKLTGNLGLKLIALFLGFLIWLFVTNNNDPVRSIMIANVPINIVNEDSIADIGKVVEAEGSGTVTLKVTERRSVLNRLSRTGSNFYVEANMENINQMNTVPLTVTCDNSSVTWDEIALSPSSLKVTLEDKVEQAFPVTVTTSGEVAPGQAVGRTEVSTGKSILIAGPESLVGIINQVTAPVVVGALAEDTEMESVLRVFDRNGAELTESQMNSLEFKSSDGSALAEHKVTVKVYLWEMRSDVPIRVETSGMPDFGYRVSGITLLPASVTLIGTTEAFEQVGESLRVRSTVSVEGASKNVTEEVDLTDTLSGYTDLRLPADTDPVISVEVQIEKTGDVAVDIPLSNIVLENRPTGVKLLFTPADKITIGVHALDDSNTAVDADEVQAVVDLADCSKGGTYDVPVEITLPKGYELGEEVMIKVSVVEEEGADTGSDTQSDTADAEIRRAADTDEEGE